MSLPAIIDDPMSQHIPPLSHPPASKRQRADVSAASAAVAAAAKAAEAAEAAEVAAAAAAHSNPQQQPSAPLLSLPTHFIPPSAPAPSFLPSPSINNNNTNSNINNAGNNDSQIEIIDLDSDSHHLLPPTPAAADVITDVINLDDDDNNIDFHQQPPPTTVTNNTNSTNANPLRISPTSPPSSPLITSVPLTANAKTTAQPPVNSISVNTQHTPANRAVSNGVRSTPAAAPITTTTGRGGTASVPRVQAMHGGGLYFEVDDAIEIIDSDDEDQLRRNNPSLVTIPPPLPPLPPPQQQQKQQQQQITSHTVSTQQHPPSPITNPSAIAAAAAASVLQRQERHLQQLQELQHALQPTTPAVSHHLQHLPQTQIPSAYPLTQSIQSAQIPQPSVPPTSSLPFPTTHLHPQPQPQPQYRHHTTSTSTSLQPPPIPQNLQPLQQPLIPPTLPTYPSMPFTGSTTPGVPTLPLYSSPASFTDPSRTQATMATVHTADNGGLTADGLRTLVKQHGLTADAEQEAETPEQMTVQLMAHQRRALEWMAKRERPMDLGEDVIAADEECLGGILADEQGLGKTLTMIAVMIKNQPRVGRRNGAYTVDDKPISDKDDLKDYGGDSTSDSGSSDDDINVDDDDDDDDDDDEIQEQNQPMQFPWRTLVVCPLSLMHQWKKEIESNMHEDHIPSVCIYHGPKRERGVRTLKSYDIVITTYATLANEYPKILKDLPENQLRKKANLKLLARSPGPIFRIHWRRVVLDEAHNVKNRSTDNWKAVMSLDATMRWCLTGTPISNTVDDIYSLFRFVRYHFVPDYETWNTQWRKTLESTDKKVRERAFKRFQTICGVVVLRRTKKDTINGRPLLSLPKRNLQVVECDFDHPEERTAYDRASLASVTEFNKQMAQGVTSTTYSGVLVMLLRLRQACCHPFLETYSRTLSTSSSGGGAGGKGDGLADKFYTPYSTGQLQEAMELVEGNQSMLDMLDDHVRSRIELLLRPHERKPDDSSAASHLHQESTFACPSCMACAPWQEGVFLQCGDQLCSRCCARARGEGSCPLCGALVIPNSTEINADELRLEVHAKFLAGTRTEFDGVAARDVRAWMKEELDRRKFYGPLVTAKAEEEKEKEKEKIGQIGNRAPEVESKKEDVLNANTVDTEKDKDKDKSNSEDEDDDENDDEDDVCIVRRKKPRAKREQDVTVNNSSSRNGDINDDTDCIQKEDKVRRIIRREDNEDSEDSELRMERQLEFEAEQKRKFVQGISKPSTKVGRIVAELNKVRDSGSGEKTLIFSQWTTMLDVLEFHICEAGHNVCRLDGSMAIHEREMTLEEFRRRKDRNVLLISLRSGGTGLNLTVASRVILVDVWWNTCVEDQAIDRVHRIGQARSVHVIKFKMKNTVEEKIYEICARKLGRVHGSLGESSAQSLGRQKLSMSELLSIFREEAAHVRRVAAPGSEAAAAIDQILQMGR